MTEPKDLLLVNEQLRRSIRRWKGLALAACSALVLVVLFGFFAQYSAQVRANRELRAANAALTRAHQACVEGQRAVNPGQAR